MENVVINITFPSNGTNECGCHGQSTQISTNDGTSRTIETSVCDSQPLIVGLKNAAMNGTALQYIQQYGKEICNAGLYECIVDFHKIEMEYFSRYINDHDSNKERIVEYPLTWQEIETFFGSVSCYDKYIGLDFIDNRISLKLLSFTTLQTCYSIPFLKGIQRRFVLLGTDTLFFSKAMIPNPANSNIPTEKIIFKVAKGGTFYYDISDFPGATGPFYHVNPV